MAALALRAQSAGMSTTTVTRKSFTYRTSTEWLGRRNAKVSSADKTPLPVSSPPEFKGEKGFWTPEDFFVAAVESCLLMTFAHQVERQQLPVEAYYSEAEGLLEFGEDGLQFTRVVIKPTVIITDRHSTEKTLKALEAAHRDCLIANSLRTIVTVVPNIQLSVIE
jgi:organic hydroperoxide reductase OsmC/OhrA